MKAIVVAAALLPLLGGCDQLKERMGLPDPTKQAAEGNAIGSACRHAGRGLEDCYRLNPKAGKAAIFAGWKEMNEYMIKNNMQAVPPEIPVEPAAGHKDKAAEGADAEAGHGDKSKDDKAKDDKAAEGKDEHGGKKSDAKADEAHAKPDDTHGKAAGGH